MYLDCRVVKNVGYPDCEGIQIKGGGSEVDFPFLIVSDRGACQLSGNFYGLKMLTHFQISKIHTITLCAQTLIAISQKST